MNEALQTEITERRRTEEALRETEEVYRAVVENVADAIVINVGTKRVFVNKAFAQMVGLDDMSQVLETPLDKFIVPEDRQLVSERTLARQRGRPVPGVYEYRIQRVDGEVRTVQTSSVPIMYQGQPAALAVLRDVTDRKRAERALQRLSHQLELILTSAGEGIYGLDIEGNTTFVNPVAARMIGWEAGELTGQPMHAILHHSKPDGIPYPSGECPIYGAFKDGAVRHVDNEVFWRKDGSSFPVEYVSAPIWEGGKLAGAVVTFKDITERKRVEAELRLRARQQVAVASLGQYALAGAGLSELLDEAVALIAETLNVEYCKVLELLPDGNGLLLRAGVGWKDGYVGRATVGAETDSQAGYTLKSSEPVIVEDLRTEMRFRGPQVLHDHGVVSGLSVIIHGRDRSFGVLGAHTITHRTFTTDDIYFLQAVANVLAVALERKRAEAALRRYEHIIAGTDDFMACINREYTYQAINQAYLHAFGKQREEIIGHTGEALFGTEVFETFLKPKQDRCLAGEEVFYEAWLDFPLRGRRYLDVRYKPFREPDGSIAGIVVSARDITDRKKVEEQLVDYQDQLRTLTLELSLAEERERRRIAAGLHDDIGQTLAMARVKVGALQQSQPSGESTQLTEEIQELIDQTIRITRSLTFELSSPILYALGLEAALQHLGERLERQNGIRCHVDVDQQQKALRAETSVVLYRIVRELIRNIEKHAHARQVQMAVGRDDDQIHITVEDDGVGFDASRGGQGFIRTGRFGLFSIREQLKYIGGRLELESVAGKGTRAVVVAPLE